MNFRGPRHTIITKLDEGTPIDQIKPHVITNNIDYHLGLLEDRDLIYRYCRKRTETGYEYDYRLTTYGKIIAELLPERGNTMTSIPNLRMRLHNFDSNEMSIKELAATIDRINNRTESALTLPEQKCEQHEQTESTQQPV